MKMGQLGAGHGATAPSAATPPLALFCPSLGRLVLTALPNIGEVVSPRFNVPGGQFGTFHEGSTM